LPIKKRLKRDGLGSMAKIIFVGEIMGDFGFFLIKILKFLFTMKGNFCRILFFSKYFSHRKNH
jgi:hypothetical protein